VPCAEVHRAGEPTCWIGIHRAGIPHPAVPRREGMWWAASCFFFTSSRGDLTSCDS
jgi:hypothetical protein